MRKTAIVLSFFLFSSIIAFAQNEEWYINKPIIDITFKGLENISISELEGITNQYIGELFTDTLYWDLQSKLFALNFFEQFTPNAIPGDKNNNSVIIEFTVTERPLIDDIVITGNKNIRKTDILDVILLKHEDILNKTKIKLDADAIKSLYIEKGFPDIQINWNIEKDTETGRADVIFSIVEGNQTKVKKIHFSGNSFASESTLRKEISTKEQSLFTTGVFQESKLADDKQNILNYYQDRGYIDAKVIDITKDIETEDDKNSVILTYYIEEGSQFTYGGTSFIGNSLFSYEELDSLIHQIPGKILNKTKLEEDFMRISDNYYNNGYIFNTITRKENRDEQKQTIFYIINIIERSRAHIDNIIIKGNLKTKDYVILRELPFKEGDIFSKDKVIEGIRNLYNLQYFSVIAPETPQGRVAGLMDLILNVEEGKTTDINFGLTFSGASGEFPVMGFLKWTDNNFKGKGQELSANSEISPLSQNLTFSFKENWIDGKRWTGGINLSLEHALNKSATQDILFPIFSEIDENNVPDPYDGHWVDPDTGEPASETQISDGTAVTDYAYDLSQGIKIDDDYLMEYNSYNVSIGINTGYTLHTPAGRFGIGTGINSSLSFINYDPEIYRPFNSSIRDNLNTGKFIDKWNVSLSWDTRDIIYNPSKGFYLNQRLTYAGGFILGERDYIKTISKAEGFLTLIDIPVFDEWNFKTVFAVHTAFSLILPQFFLNNEKIWNWDLRTTPNDLLYTDSMTIARDWPRMLNGEAMWDNWIEFRMPIIEQYFWMDSFLSSTAFWTDREDIQSLGLNNFYFTLGSGIRLTIPGLPIAFYLVKRFKFEDNTFSSFQWQPGSIFATEENESSGLGFVISFNTSIF